MKKILQIFLLLLAGLYFGQTASNFKYIFVPLKFKNEKANNYKLNLHLASQLKAKKFTVTNDPAIENVAACDILTAEITDISNMFTNKIRVDFKDCNDKTITSLEGKSIIKELEEGMKDALQNAMKSLMPSNPVENNLSLKNNQLTQQNSGMEKITTDKKGSDEQNKMAATLVKNSFYTNGSLNLVKVQLVSGEFILLDPTTFQPYATFKPSLNQDVYSVQLESGANTLGHTKEGKIIIELPTSDGKFKNEVFSKK